MSEQLSRRRLMGTMLGGPALVGVGRYLQEGAVLSPDRSRKLIISSDDAGMCPSVNEGTIKAMLQGAVSSASIMTCCPAFDEFADFAVQHPELDYGVHLVLTCDLRETPWGPLEGKLQTPSLVDTDGYFRMWPDKDIRITEVER